MQREVDLGVELGPRSLGIGGTCATMVVALGCAEVTV